MNIDTRAMVAAMFDGIDEPINPRDFIRPDGSYDLSPLNAGEREHVATIRRHLNLPANDEE